MKTQIPFILILSYIIATLAMPLMSESLIKAEKTKEKHHLSKYKVNLYLEDIKADVNNSIYCPICEFLVDQGENFISKNTSEEDAVHFLDNLCDRLPKSKQEMCDGFVNANFHKLIEFIIDKENSHKVCTQLHFCEEFSANNEVSECDFCRYSVYKIENFLHHNNTLNDIIEFGEMFCQDVKLKYVKPCNYIIPFYYSQIVSKLIEQNNFANTCQSLHLCK